MSTTTRMLAGFLALFAVALYLLLQPILKRVERQYLEAAEEPMVDTARLLAALLEQHIQPDGAIDPGTMRAALASARAREFRAQIYDLTKTSINTNVYVTDRHGKVLFDSDEKRAEGQNFYALRDVRLTLLGEYGARASRTDPADSMTATLFVDAPIYYQGEIAGVVSVSKPQRSMLAFIEETRAQIRWLALLFFLVVVLGAVLVTSVFSRPIRRLTKYARAITRGERVAAPPRGAPEVTQLALAFEEMRDALENREYVQTYVQTLTHEMKGPLAAIRGAAELLQEAMPEEHRARFLANIEAESVRLGTQIDRLLALSAIENRRRLDKREPVVLGDLAEGVCAHLRVSADLRGLSIALQKEANPLIAGEAFLMEIALSNLVQNAIDFSPDGGKITVTLSAEGNFALLVVEDEGPGIPPYALPRVFDRFYSLQHPATGRKSSGLGLCFVREAAVLHGGEAAIGNRQQSNGARAILRLPRMK